MKLSRLEPQIPPQRAFDTGIVTGIVLLSMFLVGSGAFTWRALEQMREDSRWVEHTRQVRECLYQVQGLALEAGIGPRGYLVSGDPTYLAGFSGAEKAVREELAELEELTRDNPERQITIPALREDVESYLASLQEIVDARRRADFSTAEIAPLVRGLTEKKEQFSRHIQEIHDAETELLAARADRSRRSHRLAVGTVLLTVILGLVGVAAFLWQLARTLRMRDRAAEVIQRDREQLRITLASIGDGVIVTDANGKVTFLNAVAEQLCGWPVADARGQPLTTIFKIVNETTREPVENPALRAIQDGTIVGLANHTVLISRDGSECAIADSAAPVKGQDDKTHGAVLVFRDVTEDRKAENALRESEARTRAVLETAIDTIITCDVAGRVVEFNPAAEAVFGYSREEVIGRDLAELVIPPQFRDRHRKGLKRYLATKESTFLNRRVEMSALRSNGEEFPVELAVTQIADVDPPFFTAYLRDITERKRSEKELANRMRLLALTAEVSKSLSKGDDLKATLQGCAESFVRHLDAARVRIWTVDETGRILEQQACRGPASSTSNRSGGVESIEAVTIDINQSEFRSILQNRTPRLSNSLVGNSDFPAQEWIQSEKLASFAGYPIVTGNQLVGLVEIFGRQPFDAQTLDVIASVTDDMAVGIDRHRALRAVLEERTRLHVTLSSIGDAVLTTDEEGRVLFLNSIAQSLTGWSVEEAAGQPTEAVFRIVNEQTGEVVENPVRRVLKEGVIVGLANHTVLISKSGSRRPIDDSGAPIRLGDSIIGAILVFRDVTERRRAERLLTDQNRILETIIQEEKLSDVLEMLCRTAEEQIDDDAVATLSLWDESGYHLAHATSPNCPREIADILPTLPGGEPWNGPDEIQRSVDRDLSEVSKNRDRSPSYGSNGSYQGGKSQFEEDFENPERVLRAISDIAEDPRWGEHRDLVLPYGLRSCWTTQIYSSTRQVLGSLTIYSDTFRAPTSNDLQLVGILSRTAGIVIERELADSRLHDSEERVRMALEAARMVAWDSHPGTGKANTSENAGEVFGLKPDQSLTEIRQLGQLMDPEDVIHRERMVAEAVEAHESYMLQFRIRRPIDGKTIWLEERGLPIFDPTQRLLRIASVFTDVTERVHAEEQLQESQANAATALSVAQLGTWSWDIERNEFNANSRCREVCALSSDGPLTIEDFMKQIHPTDWTRVDAAIKAALDVGGSGKYAEEFRFVHPDGSERWVISHGQTLFYGEGAARRAARIFGTLSDITERKKLEEGLRTIAADLSEANRRKNEFLATLAHELRNPLAPIRTGLEILKLAKDDPEMMEETRGMMERQTQQMVRLIDDLLDVSRITQGKLQLRKCRVALAEVIRNSVEATQPFIDEAEHTLEVSVAEQPIVLNADPNRMAQVISNLLSNAVKYTKPGGRIWLSAEQVGKDAVIRVRDNGIGIPKNMQLGIFEMFTQIDRPMEKGYTGLGIGLTLVKRLVEMHDGTIDAASDGENQGSEFTVRIPVFDVIDIPVDSNGESSPRIKPTTCKILVVDDNTDAAQMLQMVLRMLGHTTRIANDGLEAVHVAGEFLPDVVLMDLGMPKLNGYEAAQEIRSKPWGQQMMLVALTGWGQEEDKQRTRDAGFDYHLTKPADPATLQQLLANRLTR